MNKRTRPAVFLATIGLLAASLVGAGAAGANPVQTPVAHRGLEVHLRPFVTLPDASNGAAPRISSVVSNRGDLFVVEESDGIIYRVSGNIDSPSLEQWFDVGAAISASTPQELDTSNKWHGGLRSVAFHPEFSSNGLFYASVMETRPASKAGHRYLSDVANPIGADSVLIEWRVNLATGRPITDSYREVFRVGMPVYDHPIKGIAFNQFARPGDSDYGLLYIAHGDGSVKSATAGGGQHNDALGKILRINPLRSGSQPFSVPASNPFVDDPSMLDSVYSIGHRNPHQISFANTGTRVYLLAAEAGRDNVEEINIIVPGGDYGWPQREGTFVHLSGGGVDTGVAPLPADDARFGFVYPAAQVGHTGTPGASFVKQAIAGGYVTSNGSPLSGQYLYSDFAVSGRLYHSAFTKLIGAKTSLSAGQSPGLLTQAPTGLVKIKFDHDSNPATSALDRDSLLDVFNDSPNYETNRADVRFGQGPAGELYISSKRSNTVYLVTSSLPGGPGGFPGSRSTFACGVELRGNGFDIDWANEPAGADRIVISRSAFDRSWWRGRANPTDRFFRDEGLLPSRSSRIDFLLEAKAANGSVIDTATCLVRDSEGLNCLVTRKGADFTISWTGAEGRQVVIKRQVTDGGPFYWRQTDWSSPARDSSRPGEIRYEVLARDSNKVVVAAAACRVAG